MRIVACDTEPQNKRPTDRRQRTEGCFSVDAHHGRLEFIDASDRQIELPVSPSDSFVATTWSTAHIAWEATRVIGRDRFLYLIPEYEPLTFPAGATAMAAQESYALPHFAVFSTEPVRDHFRAMGIGVFADGCAGDVAPLSFDNAITPVDPPTVHDLRARTLRRLLFYCPAEAQATGNMFELGTIGLARAAEAGWLAGWEVNGVGSVSQQSPIELAPGVDLVILDRVESTAYARLLRAHDVGLALMATPHPSLVSLEMASAAMCTVTNSCGVKDHAWLERQSRNFVVVDPTVRAITEGIRVAVGPPTITPLASPEPDCDGRARGRKR